MVFLEISENSQENTCASKLAQVFSCEFSEISNNTFFTEHLRATASEEQHLPFKQTGTTIIFSFGYQSCTWPCSDPLTKHILVVTVELIWLLLLNILSFNFVPTPNKSLLG